jgi:hypothetical protein
MMTTRTQLDQAAIEMALADENAYGFGYYTSTHLPRRFGLALDEAVVIAANLAGWDYEQLVEWTNSKAGRHLVDEASSFLGRHEPPTAMELVPLATRYIPGPR